VHVDFGKSEKQVLKARFLQLQFYSGSFEMPGIDHLRIGGKCGVQVKYFRGFVWLCSHALTSLYIGINYVPQLVPLALLWAKKWPTNLRIKSC
jgi:hypothetical protein